MENRERKILIAEILALQVGHYRDFIHGQVKSRLHYSGLRYRQNCMAGSSQ